MSTLAERMREALDGLPGVKPADLARACQVAPASVSNWLSGETKSLKASTAIRAAEFLGVSQLWLAEGKGQKSRGLSPLPNTQSASELSESNVLPGPDRKGRVPLISWVQAGDWSHASDMLQPGDAFDWVETGVSVKEHTFALRITGDSMEPEFVEGTIIVVEPEMDPLPGDYVVAKNGQEEATFKQLIRDGSDLYLKPLNPRYPIKPLGNARIIGVVREAVKRYR